ncbi:MAG: hypothetical protein AABX86_02715, partial [Nanoarchaeota archaeon]
MYQEKKCYIQIVNRIRGKVRDISYLESVIQSSMEMKKEEIRKWLGECNKVLEEVNYYRRDKRDP